MAKRAVLGHDIVQALVDGLGHIHSMPQAEREALSNMLRSADLVTLTFGLEPSCSLNSRQNPIPVPTDGDN